jgi:hypothetical protein
MPSRMLVALTAAIAPAPTPARCSAWRTQPQISAQLAAVSKRADPLMPGT